MRIAKHGSLVVVRGGPVVEYSGGSIRLALRAFARVAVMLFALLAPWRIATAGDTLTPEDRAAIAAELAKSGHVVLAGLTESRINNPAVGSGSDGQSGDQFGYVTAVNGNTAVVGAPQDSVGPHTVQGSAYVFVRTGTAWSMQAKLTAADGASNDQFGATVAITADTIVIGAPRHSAHATNQDGAAYVYTRAGTTWTLQQTLSASDGGVCGSGQFGYAVALSGNTALVGEYRNCTLQVGVAHVFVRSGTTWSEQAALTQSDASLIGPNYFGSALAIDGNIAVVGAFQWYDGVSGYPGAAYVFTRSGTTWTQQAHLTSDDNELNSYFGSSVSVSGTTVVVTAPFKTIGTNPGQGAVYVYTQSGATWPLQQKITTTDGAANTYLGNYQGNGVSLSADTLAIAAQGGVSGIGGPRAYIFTRTGSAWTQRKIIRGGAGNAQIGSAGIALDSGTLVAGGPTNPDCGDAFVQTGSAATWNNQATLDRGCSPAYAGFGYGFGAAVAVDGDTAVVGAPASYLVSGTASGRVYVFVRQGAGWVLQAQLIPSDTLTYFGAAVAVSGDTIAVKALDGGGAAAYVFQRSGTTWTQQAKLLSPNGGAGGEDVGTQALALEGNTLIVGEPRYDAGATSSAGIAYVFTRSGTTWTVQQTLSASDAASSDYFGYSVALDGNTAVIGSRYADIGANADQGAAYVYTRSGTTWAQQQKIVAADGAASSDFGWSVAVSGNTAAVSAPPQSAASGSTGQVYVWVRSGTTWTLQTTLSENGAQQYGTGLAIDGDTLAVGAPNGYEFLTNGGTYIYWRSGTSWTQHDELANPDQVGAGTADNFGGSVAISGGLTFIGASFADGPAPFGNPREGAAFAYAYVEATTTTITGVAPEPSHVGSAATISVTVDAERVAATSGTVTVTASTGETCTITALSGGTGSTQSTGSCAITFATLGARTLTASYSGAVTYDPSTSSTASHTVDKAPTTLAISADTPDPSVVGQPYPVVVALTGGFTPTGNIAVGDGSATCTITLPATSCNLTSTSPGSKTLTATYAGDTLNIGSSTTATHTVTQAATTLAITSDTPDPSEVGTAYAVAVALSVTSPGAGTPGGTISVSDGAATCSITLPSSSCNLTSTTTGIKTLVATYAGNTNFLASTSPGVAHTVSNHLSTTTITGTTPSTSVVGQPVAVLYSVTSTSGTSTGSVTVTSGSGETCTATIAAGTCSLTFTSAGSKTLLATYAGDSNFAGSSGSGSQVVNKAATSIAITADTPDPSVVGQAYAVTVAVAVTAPGAGATTGTVSVSDGSATCSITLPATSCNLTSTTTGTKTLVATYAGDANFLASTSPGVSHTVNGQSTTTTITSTTPSPSVVGQSVSVAYSVTASSGTPTGNVTITANSGETCTATVAAAACPLTFTSAGSKTLTASYAGSGGFNASTGTGTQTVNKAATSLAITADTPDPSTIGQPYAVTVALAVSTPGAGTPTGTIGVSDGAATCSITLPASSCNLTSTTAGTKTLVATYAGDANFATSVSPGASHVVSGLATTTTITGATPSPSVVGQAVSVAYTVTATSGTPTGNVTVTANTGETCTATVATAACSLTFASAGTNTLTAAYAGDANDSASTGTGSQVVNKGGVTVSVSGAPATTVIGQAFTASVTVAAASPAAGTPGGTVTVSMTGATSCTVTLVAGTGSCTLTPQTVGAFTVTASYAGDANFTAGSGTVAHTVNKGDVAVTVSESPATSVAGQAFTVTATVAAASPAAGTPGGTVVISAGSLTCSATLAAGSGSCALTPLSAGTLTLTANYGGDASFNTGTGNHAHTVNKAVTSIAITSDTPDPSEIGEAYTVTVALAVTAPGAGTPTGTIGVSDGSATCSITLPATTCALTSTTSGSKTLVAVYAGDANFLTSTSPGVPHVVNKHATTTTISGTSPSPSVVGQSVAVSYTVTATSGTPTGNVTVTASSGETCTATVATGTCSLSFASAGTKTLTAVYAGDASNATSTGTGSQTVGKGSVSVSATTTPLSPVVGQPIAVQVTVTAASPASGTPGGTVNVSAGSLSCTLTLSAGAGSCSITPTSASTVSITVAYAGDANFNAGSSTTVTTVGKAATTLAISSDTPDPSTPGQSVTVVVALGVTAPGAGTPSGPILVGDGVDACTIDLPATSCALTLSTPGTRTLTATYVGDANFEGSSATATHTVLGGADLAIAISDDQAYAQFGKPVVYTITATNAGPQGVTGAHVVDVLPSNLAGGTWSCTGAGGGTCTASGSGSIDEAIDLPAGASVTFVLTATVATTPDETLVNQATIAPPVGTSDPDPSNDTATDTDTLVLFRDGFEGDAPAPLATASIDAANLGDHTVTLELHADDSQRTQVVLSLVDLAGIEQARLVQSLVGVDEVRLAWVQRATDGLWSVASSRLQTIGSSVRVDWTIAMEENDHTLVATGLTLASGD